MGTLWRMAARWLRFIWVTEITAEVYSALPTQQLLGRGHYVCRLGQAPRYHTKQTYIIVTVLQIGPG